MNKFKAFWLAIWNYIKYIFSHPKDLIIPVLVAEAIFWIPVWVPALLALIFNPWWWSVAVGAIAFWCGPFTPAIPLQVGFIALCERIYNKIKNKNLKGDNNNDGRNDQ